MGGRPRIVRWLLDRTLVRIVGSAARAFSGNNGPQLASSLSFQTLLSTVPALLFVVGILRYVLPGDSEKRLLDMMGGALVPSVARRVTDELMRMVDNFTIAALGWIGAVATVAAAFMLVLNLKSALDAMGFRSSRTGTLKRLGWVALVVILLPPLLWFVVTQGWGFLQLPGFLKVLRPFLSTTLVIFLVYRFLPDRGPTTASALASASMVALVLEIEKLGMTFYARQFSTTWEVIYGTLGFLPILLVSLYVTWSILLIGAGVAWAIDDVLDRRRTTELPPDDD
jgi:membrane protein